MRWFPLEARVEPGAGGRLRFRGGRTGKAALVLTGDFQLQETTIQFYDVTTARADRSVTIVEKAGVGDAPLEPVLTTTAARE